MFVRHSPILSISTQLMEIVLVFFYSELQVLTAFTLANNVKENSA